MNFDFKLGLEHGVHKWIAKAKLRLIFSSSLKHLSNYKIDKIIYFVFVQ